MIYPYGLLVAEIQIENTLKLYSGVGYLMLIDKLTFSEQFRKSKRD